MSQCTITVKGKDKDKFDFLSKKFGQRAALQSLIEADETVSVPGFISEVEIGTRINAFAFSILNNLITKSSGASVINLVNTEIMPLELESAILAAKRDLEASLEEILLKEDISEQDKYKATRIVVALKSFEDLRPKIMDRLNSYGLKMSEINNDIDDLLNDEESEETSKEHIYSMAHTEKNPVDSIPPSVKLYLATLHDLTTDSMGQDTMKLDDIGMAVPVNFDFIYGKLLKNLADIATYEEMVAKIEELSEFDPVIRKIYSDLENDKLNGSVDIILPDGTKARTFENALFSAFKTTHNEFITVAHETVENEGVKALKASVYPTNKRKQYKTILQRWATNASKIIDAPIESRVTAWNNTLSKVFYPYRDSSTKGAVERKKLYKARLNDSNNFNVLVEVSNALYYLGIDMTPDEVGLLRKEMNKKSAKFGDFIDKTIAPLAEKLWNKGDNIYTDEKGNLTKLSKTVAAISNDISVETFINGENNQIYPINLPTYFSELFTALKSDTQVRRNYILDPLYTSFKFIRDFINGEEIQSALFDTIYNNDMNEGVPFDKLDPVSAMAARFSLFMNFNHKGDPDSQKGWILPPTPSDRSGTSVVRMPKMQFESFSYSAIIDENSELMKWFTGVLEGEFQRIQRVRYEFNTKDKSDLIENYHYKGNKLGNGGFFNYYPDFNSLLVSDDAGFVEDIDFNSPEVTVMKKAVMEKIIEADVTYLSEIGFLEPVPYNQNGKLDYTSIKPSEITAKLAPKEMIIDFNVLNFIAHSLIATHELSALANGDLAFFKAEEIVPGITTANLENANKRAGMAATPGRKLRVGSGGARSKFKVAFLNDAIVSSDSDYLKMLEGVLGKEMAAKYMKTNSTDGQGFVSLKRYAEILNGQGLLTPSLAQTINELQKPVDKINWDKVTEPLNPVKGFYHGLDFNSETESMEAHSLKYSLLPIFPAAIVNNPTMQSLYNRMIQSNIDEAVFESGAKYGATKLNSLESDELLKFIELSNHNWRVPQVVPYKTKTEENFGSQMRKLIMGNIEVTADYNGKTGQQLRDDYQNALSLKIERAYKKLAKSISTNGKFDPVKIAGKIKEELARNSFKNVSDFLFKALEVSEGETRMPMSFPSIKGRVESSLNSMVRKAVNKLSLPGFVGVVYSSVGYSKNQIKYSQDLKMARLSEDGKTVLPAEIIASPQYFIQSLLKKRKKLVKEYEKSKTEEPLNMEVNSSIIEVFEENPELSKIGTLEQYARYLATVFPDSKLREILYHWARTPFDVYDKSKREAASSDLGEYLNVSLDKEAWRNYAESNNKKSPVLQRYLINLKNPYYTVDYYADKLGYNSKKNAEDAWFEDVIESTYDGIIENDGEQIAIFNEENILKLGSSKDVEGFKNFINSTSSIENDIQALDLAVSELKKGNFDITKIPEDLRKVVTYRIPTQGKNSMMAAIIVGFTPESLGSTVTLPAEIVTQSGMDYDIDKIYLEIPHFEFNSGKFDYVSAVEGLSDQQLDNIIIDTHYTVLTNPAHFKELMTPNNSDTLVELVKELSPEGTGARYWGSLATQDVFRDQNQAGGIFIGIASIANTAHTVFQELGVRIKGRFDKANTSKVSSNLGAFPAFTGLVSQEMIGPNDVMVFGANKGGFHGQGMAALAYANTSDNYKKWNSNLSLDVRNNKIGDFAVAGKTEFQIGNKGMGYGLVTVSRPGVPLTSEELASNIEKLLKFAQFNPSKRFIIPYNSNSNLNRQSLSDLAEIFNKFSIPSNVVFGDKMFKEIYGDIIYSAKEHGKGVKVNGVFVDSLSQVYSMDNKGESTGRYISDDHIEIQTAAVDNASNPLLGKLNINTVTGSTYLFLVEAGLGLKYPTYLVNTPIIKELVKRTRANEATMGPEAAFSNALSDLAKERQIDTLQVESQDFDVTENILKDSIDQSKEGKNTTTHDAQILLAFLTFRKYGQEMHQVQSALKIDNIGPKQSLAANLIQQVELSKVSGTYSDSLESGVVSVNPADKVSLIELDRELYSKHSLENYEKYGLHGAIEANSSVIADGSPLVMEVVSKFQDITGSRLNEKDVRMLINDFYTYLFINAHSSEFGASTLSIFEGRDVAKLLLGKNSVGKRVIKAQKEDLLEAKKDITHTPNRFLQFLTVTLGEKRSGYDTVSFNNTLSKALSGDQKTMISNEYLKMFESENEELSELAQDLFLYNMFTKGFNSGIDSFSEYIPMELYESIENPETGKSLIEEFKAMVSNFTQPNKFDTDTFILRFLQNRGTQLQGLKDLRKLNIKALKEYLSTHPNVRYFIARSPQKSGFGIAKNLGKGFYNIVASPIGVKNVHVEYQSGNFISELTSSADVLNRALYSEDVIETENSTCVL